MKLGNLTPTKFRILLLSILGVAVIASVAVTYFGQSFIRTNSESVIEAVSSEFSSKNRLERLQKAGAVLESHKDSMEKAKQLTASSNNFDYQQQLIDDLNRYAERAGIVITGYSFNISESGQADSTPTPTVSERNSIEGGGDGADPSMRPSAAAPQKATVTATIQSPIQYETLLRFLSTLETSLPKISVQDLQLTRSDTNPNEISLSSLNLEVSVTQ